jgi:hypothetical protein
MYRRRSPPAGRRSTRARLDSMMQPSARRTLATLAILALCLLVAPGRGGAAKKKTKAPASPTPAPLVELVQGGATPFRIETRSAKLPEAAFAAAELTRYLAKISGATLAAADKKTTGPRIVIGMRKDLSAADRALLPRAAKGHDGYAIALTAAKKGRPARRVVAGDQPRGLVYGVYDLLERLGCQFTHPLLDPSDPEVVPARRDLSLPAGRWAVASKVRYRTLAWFEWRQSDPAAIDTTPEALALQIDWAMKSRYNVFESAAIELPPEHPLARALHAANDRGMMLQAPGHNFDLFLPDDPATFAAHPDWFGMKDGKRTGHHSYGAQFCWTNAAAGKVFTDNVVSFVRARPDLDVLALSGLDGGVFLSVCGCEACAKHGPSDNVIELLNGTVRRLAKVRPDVVVETLGGYQYSEQPPKTAKPDRRLRAFWADWNRAPTAGYGGPTYGKRRQANLDAWARAFDGRLTVFQYYSDHYKHSWFIGPLATQMVSDRRYLIEHGIDGMLNLLYPDGYWWRASLNAWLAGRLFYDASTDPFVLLRDYALAYYGPAGEPMAGYLDEWARDPALGMRAKLGAQLVHLEKLREQRRKFLIPAASRAAGDPVAERRVASIERLHRLAETIMESEIAGTQSDKLRERGNLEGARRMLELSRRRLSEAKAEADAMIAERRGLLDVDINVWTFPFKEKALAKRGEALEEAAKAPVASGASPSALRGAPEATPAASPATQPAAAAAPSDPPRTP